MSRELPKIYEPQQVEERIYNLPHPMHLSLSIAKLVRLLQTPAGQTLSTT